MNIYKKPKINELELKKNPFVFSLEIPIVKLEDAKKFIIDNDGDILHDVIDIEYERPVRIYVSSARRKIINLLSPNTCKLLKWIEQELDENKDFFWLNKQRYMSETLVAYNTYKKSINELQVNNFISSTIYSDTYWVNPYFFYFGNRVKKYPKNIKVK